MRLLTVGSLPPEWGGAVRGGAATFHAALLTALLERGADVEVVGTLVPAPLDREIPVPAWVRPEGVSRASFYEGLLERLRPDVVLMSHIAHTVGVTHARLGSPVPALGVVHSWHNVTFRTGEERRRAEAVTAEALSGLSAVIAPSRHCLAEGRQLNFEYPPIAEAIHNPVPPLHMTENVDVQGHERRGALYLGSLIARKNPAGLVEASARLPALQVSLVGEGDLEGELRERIAALGIDNRVRLETPPNGDGHLSKVREMLLRAKVMCLPSRSEGLPLAFIEALACGTPVVGSGPSLREIRDELGIEIGVPLDAGTPEEIAAALETVLAADWDRAELRRATLRGFGLDRVADRYVELLSCVSSRPEGRGDAGGSPQAAAAPERSPMGDAGAVCVLGMSRTGTSLTARVLSLAGVYLGPEEELLGDDLHQLAGEGEQVRARARSSNPEGHWEHYRLMRFNERILRLLGGNWRDPPPMPHGWEDRREIALLRDEAHDLLAESFGGHDLWGWKDPRNSLTLPFWQRLLPRMRYVICLRNPVDVAASLERRDAIPPEAGIALWMTYLTAAIANTAGRPRLFVPYESYFAESSSTAAGLARFVGREEALDGPAAKRALGEAVDERLWRNRSPAGKVAGADCMSPAAAALLRTAELLAAVADGAGQEVDRVAGLNAAADLYVEGLQRRFSDTSQS